MTVVDLARDSEHPALPAEAATSRAPGSKPSSYGQILRSSAVVAGGQVVSIAIGIARTKAMALLLGPAGVGLMGALSAIADLARNAAELGINASGVRQVAEANASGDQARIARTVLVLRRVSVLLGLIAAAGMVLLATPIARLTFGDPAHTNAVAMLSVAVLCGVVAGAQRALVQGLRRIGDLARITVGGALLGAIASIGLVYWLGSDGIALSVVAMAATAALASWWYSRKIRTVSLTLPLSAAWQEARALLRLGLAFMVSGLLIAGAAYAVRMLVIREQGMDAAGHFHAAWTLGGLYIGIVLQAMSADFYPRLVGAISDHDECNRLVNEQAHVSQLLAGVGVLATISLAPLVLTLFYSKEFGAAAEALRWICFGMMLRVISFPMGYIIIARGSQGIYIVTEVAWTVVNVTLSWWFIKLWGLAGAGIAFFASYVFHVAMIWPIVSRLTGFRWSGVNRSVGVRTLALMTLVMIAFKTLQPWLATVVGLAATATLALTSVKHIAALTDSGLLPQRLNSLLLGIGASRRADHGRPPLSKP